MVNMECIYGIMKLEFLFGTEGTTFKNNLKGRLSKVQVMYYAKSFHNDEYNISSLCDLMLSSSDERVAYNAAWILYHLSAEDKDMYLKPFYDRIVDMGISPDIKIRRGLVLSIIVDMVTAENFRTDLYDFCLVKMNDRKESDSSRSAMIKLTAKMCKFFPELAAELAVCLESLSEETKPSIATASRNALKSIQ